MKKIMILSNHFLTIFLFRKELISRLIDLKYNVYIVTPEDKDDYFMNMGCSVIKVSIDRHGMNPIKDFGLIIKLYKIINEVSPDVVLSYTIKPNIYGGVCCKLLKTDFLPNVTGLGSGLNANKLVKKLLINMYRLSFNNQKCVFLQNVSNKDFLISNNIKPKNYVLLPGSGVNLEQYRYQEYTDSNKVNFFFIARVMKEKGIEEYFEVAKYCHRKGYNTNFHVLGFCEESYEDKLKELSNSGIVIYHGMSDNVISFQKINHCTICPSYHEGMSNVLLETAASGRPCLCSNIPGCREIVDDGKTGYLFSAKDKDSLINAVEKFLALSYDEKREMGLKARKKVEKEFDRNIVINKYIEVISKL